MKEECHLADFLFVRLPVWDKLNKRLLEIQDFKKKKESMPF